VALTILLVARRSWVGSWVGAGGRATTEQPKPENDQVAMPEKAAA
jgi:hypothetical protein